MDTPASKPRSIGFRAAPIFLAAFAFTTITTAPAAWADGANPLVPLVDAAAQRLQTADPVAAYKWRSGASVDDQARVDQVLATVTAHATASHIDPTYVTEVFTDQVDATDAVEYSRFAQWKLEPDSAPTAAPDLSASRSAIDALNDEMVTEIAALWDVLHSPACGSDLDDARNAVADTRRLDALYRQALTYATHSYCR